MSNYDLLIQKLDSFIRKFYFNKLLKGLLYTVAVIIGLFLILNLLEHNFYFKTGVRKVLFFGFVGISLASLTFWVLTPLAKYFRLGKVIDHEQAALIIGDHFGTVKDKLLNILQLKNQDHGTASEALIRASIEQKTEDIKLVPFRSAIDLSSNKKYLKYALPPAMLLLVLLFAAPSLITEPTHRLINNNKEFEKDAPFHFHINNQDLDVIQFEDKVISVDVDGEEIPDEVFINVDDFQYRMKKQDATSFSYTFKDVQKDIDFHFFSGRVKSSDHELNVLLRPNLTEFQLYLNYPDYLGRKDERLSNRGDMFIPEGTVVTWNFKTENTDEVYLKFASESNPRVAEKRSEVDYRISRNIKKDDSYKLYIANENIPTPDSIGYTINVIPDQHPEIKAESFVDSLEKTLIYFVGNASDDHGLTSLNFQYTVTNSSGTRKTDIIPLQKPTAREMQFNHTFDLTELNLKPGDKVSYFFETKDNDGVNGPKSAKTNLMEFEKPSLEEFEDMENINEEEIKDKLEEALKESKEIQEALKKLREKMLQKQEPDWEDKKELEKLLERQKELNEELKEAKEKFKENIKNQEEFTKRDEELLEKQERLEELFEEATNDETEQLMEKIQELMEELNKDQMLEQMEEMRMDDQEQEMEMDRLLELFKNLEVEKEMQDMIEKLEEMAEQQEELAKETEEEKKSQDQLEKEQEELNKEMEDLEKKMEELEKKNEELERPKDMGEENEEQMEDIQEDMKESSEKMEQKDNKGASQKQKQAAEKMKKMASAMQSAMDSDQKQQMEEDIKALRQLLENLVNLSFDQEDLHDSFRKTQYYTPKYVELTASQHDLKDDFSLIQDSLFALAKRNDKIQPFVTEKVTVINDEMGKNLENLVCESCLNKSQKDNSFADAKAGQRTIMKNVNDLALMLSESMEQMQQQMSGMMSGNQMCNKPGGSGGKDGKVPMDKISEGQKDLNDGLKKQAEQGKQGDGKNGMSAKDFAQAAARQAALRKALEELAKEKSEQGKGSKELQDIIEGMDQIETDLVNKKLDNQLLMRQQDILTRLLQAEKADRQRDKDNKRKAERGKEQKKELPPALQEYLKEREAEIEMYKKVSPSLRPFYKQLVDEYYKALKSR